uniref:Uncharacterized protein n=1 Tax=Arundo donax TaxID=35708 RepID=A0A0A8ZW89_ARUDO
MHEPVCTKQPSCSCKSSELDTCKHTKGKLDKSSHDHVLTIKSRTNPPH